MKKKLFCLALVLALVFAAAATAEGQDAKNREAMPEPYRTVGAHVPFRSYPQTESGEDQTPIEWIVLEVDEENHKALLLTYYGLDTKRVPPGAGEHDLGTVLPAGLAERRFPERGVHGGGAEGHPADRRG